MRLMLYFFLLCCCYMQHSSTILIAAKVRSKATEHPLCVFSVNWWEAILNFGKYPQLMLKFDSMLYSIVCGCTKICYIPRITKLKYNHLESHQSSAFYRQESWPTSLLDDVIKWKHFPCAGISPATSKFRAQRQVMRSFDVFLDLRQNNGWVNNGEAVDLRRQRAHYDVIPMDGR